MLESLLLLISAPSGSPLDCRHAVAQADLSQCAWLDFKRADAALNTQWKRTLAYMRSRDTGLHDPRETPPGYVEALQEAQRAWLRYRDANCRVAGYRARGGTMEPMLVSDCKAAMTRVRTAELRAQAKGN